MPPATRVLPRPPDLNTRRQLFVRRLDPSLAPTRVRRRTPLRAQGCGLLAVRDPAGVESGYGGDSLDDRKARDLKSVLPSGDGGGGERDLTAHLLGDELAKFGQRYPAAQTIAELEMGLEDSLRQL